MKSFYADYTQLTGSEEDQRLRLQNLAVQYFDKDVYRRVLAQYDAPVILDVGCGTGDMIFDMVNDIPSCRVFGFDTMRRQIALAQQKHPRWKFAVLNVEADAFCEDIAGWMEAEKISGFDVINCSMVLMHLSDPQKALMKLRPLLNEGGTLIVREVDDGVQYAWPDPEGRFAHWAGIIGEDHRFGDRYCGRKVYSYLKNAGYTHIRLEKQGLTNIDLPDGKLLYEMAVPGFLGYIKDRADKNPENRQYREAYEWYADHIDALYRSFCEDDFLISLGFISFTAAKS